MEVTLNTPALLFPAIAILMLGYVNRYIGTASVIRTFKKDYDADYVHNDLVRQLKILKRRIQLSRLMISLGALALAFACLSMFLIFAEHQYAGEIIFGLSIISMIISIGVSLNETFLSNRSLMIEINDMLAREAKK